MKKEKLLIKGEGIYVKKEMKKILEGEVFWNWTPVDMGKRRRSRIKGYYQMSALPIKTRSAVSGLAKLT